MRLSAPRLLVLLVTASVAVGITGCNHETLDSGAQGLAVSFVPSPAGAGRFEQATFDIAKLQVLPTHPATGDIYGDLSLQLRFDVFQTDLTSTQASAFSDIALPQGTYQVTGLVISHPNLIDRNLGAPPYATCMEGVAVVDATDLGVPRLVTLDASSLTFTVRPGQTTLSIKLDVPAFIADYEAAFTCQTGCGPAGSNCTLLPFNEDAFKAAVINHITIE